MKIFLAALFLSATSARADFAQDQNTDHSDVLLRIVTAAAEDKHFKPSLDGNTVCYLRRAEYIGPLTTSFGTVHVAELFYIRSAPRGTQLPPRGHTYIIFLDEDFKIRSFWDSDLSNESLSVDGAKLLSGKDIIIDYSHLPSGGTVLYKGNVMGIPKWN